ncbi:MAG: SpoIIE family protein phosphatase [Candidatus Eisenbacteria bacterium]|uniref:SpoIIE family protein phosphatase n=1 Tax=Eiseniibacteriota bacterium TaxID=2212470 RepID=A0A956RPB4_UNCEI|nr:SpoIIE family protein phosphatase [Candidatus Eisenbacteria bacterium]
MATTTSRIILEGMVNGRYLRRTLESGKHEVGRTPEADIQLMHRSVSRNHATLVVADGELTVQDLESRNGTFLNEDRVTGSVVARQGDTLRFGAIELKLVAEDAPWSRTASAQNLLSGEDTLHATTRLSWADVKETRAEETSALFQVLVEAAPLLVQHRPLEDVFESVLGLIERLLTVRRVLLMLYDEERNLVMKAVRPQGSMGERMMLSQTMMDTVIQERSSMLVTDAQADERFKDRHSIVSLDVRSAMVAPLFDNEQVIGLIYADTSDPLVRYDDNQLRAFTLLANLIAVKITQTNLLEQQREKERLAQEMATAARIQKSLLPAKLPQLDGYEIFAQQMPCFETAGDLYDVEQLANGGVEIVVGDVSGKGLGAALLMSNVMASLRLLYEGKDPIGHMVERLNNQVHRSTEVTSFVTLFFGRLDPAAHTLEFVNGGHNPPLLILPDRVEELQATGIPIGVMPKMPYGVQKVTLPEDGILCIFTDGIPEASIGEDQFYEESRMIESVRKRFRQPLEEIASGMLDDLRAYLGDHEVGDDITLLLLRRGRPKMDTDPHHAIPGDQTMPTHQG